MPKPSNLLRAHLFNVGAGDHLLLEFPDSSIGIIDFHKYGKLNWHRPPAYYYLKYKIEQEKRDIKIAFICFSHYDLDHINGTMEVLDLLKKHRIHIERVWMAGAEDRGEILRLVREKYDQYRKVGSDSSILDKIKTAWDDYDTQFSQILDSLEKEFKADPIKATPFSPLHANLGECGIRAYSIAPLDKHVKKYRDIDAFDFLNFILLTDEKIKANRNLISSIIYFQHKACRLAFGGDASAEVWSDSFKEIKNRGLENECETEADFVKVSHHGSRHSSRRDVWNRLIGTKKQVYFGISAGSKHDHPHPKTIKEIKEACDQVRANGHILSTNRCLNCIAQAMIPEEDCDSWTEALQKGPRYKKEKLPDTMGLWAHGGENKKEEPVKKDKRLAAYIFEFDLHSGESRVYKGMSSHLSDIHQDCGETCKFKHGFDQ